MKHTINISDHRYIRRDFEPMGKLPALHERHNDEFRGTWYEYDSATEITNKIALHDDGDGGYYRFYVLEKLWGYLDDPDNTEPQKDDIYIAVWEKYSEEY